MNLKVVASFVVMIGLTVTANLLMKAGAAMATQGEGTFVALVNWRVIAGLFSFGLAAVMYILILRWLPLNIAQSFAAAQFVAVILASWLILSEPIGAHQWVGIFLITCGIAVVGWSQAS